MKKLMFFLLIATYVTVFVQCSGDKAKPEVEDFEVADNEDIDLDDMPENARFGFKSGVVEMESNTMGMNQFIVMYFDDWGNKISSEIHMEFMGQKMHMVSVVKDGWSYEYDVQTKRGAKKMLDEEEFNRINYLKIDDDMMSEFNMSYIGDVEILGKKCKQYEIDFKNEGFKAKTAIWQGITMESEATVNGMPVTINVTKIQENVQVPSDKFEIPSDIIFDEPVNAEQL